MSVTYSKPTLDIFTKPKKMTFEDLLTVFMDERRLKRARQIDDEELTIQEETGDQITALIRNYHAVVDLKNRVILHDCADWNRVLPSKRFCKHFGKLFLSLNREKATEILIQIDANKEEWEFRPYTE